MASTRDTRHSPPLSLGHRILVAVAGLTTLLGGFILVTTALGFGHADVRGMVLRGSLLTFFLVGLGLSVTGAAVALAGLVRRRAWGVWLLAAVWPTFALVTLALDRLTPAPGPGRPLAFYLVLIGFLPAALTVLLGRVGRRRPE